MPAPVAALHNLICRNAHHTLCGRLRATAAGAGTLSAGTRFARVRRE